MFVNPLGTSMVTGPFSTPGAMIQPAPTKPTDNIPGNDIPRFLNFLADYTGCGHWRMLWPEQVMNAYRHCVIQSSTVMISDLKHFTGVDCIRVQRQASPAQKRYLEFLRQHTSARIIYEIDDICFGEDIPDYNPFKSAFTSTETRQSIQDMMEFCDEMTVTCPSMKQYFLERTNQTNITVIPNYLPRLWIDRFYDRKQRSRSYDRNIKKPRILYAGSSSHFDIHRKNSGIDDLTHVIDNIIKTVDKFQWVFLGGKPTQLEGLISSGKIEFHKWAPLLDYPSHVTDLDITAMVAPLADNIFNECKSNIKYLEASALGIRIVCQSGPTYDICKDTFTTGDQMIIQLENILCTKKKYMSICDRNHSSINNMWLENENNRLKYDELYKHPYGNPARTNINKLNDIKN